MKRILFISFLLIATFVVADDFVDDVYYSPNRVADADMLNSDRLVPSYDKHIKEIVFVDDTISQSLNDTIRTTINNE